MAKTQFWDYLAFALRFAPPGPEEAEIRGKLKNLAAAMKTPTPEMKAAVAEGMKRGEEKIKQYLTTEMKSINGWKAGNLFGDRAFYNGNWLLRAAAATSGIYGNNAVEAVYPMGRALANGEPLDGSKHKYMLTFPAGQLPPVHAFWSVTMYDGKTQLLIKNPINRYLINSPMLPIMQKNADGSVTLYIQKDSPGTDKESNWLPAPKTELGVTMRLYAPQPSVLTGDWNPPAIEKVK